MSIKPHRIFLRGPWEYQTIDVGREVSSTTVDRRLSPVARAHFPAEWADLFGDFVGCARFRRRFHRPAHLDSHERVFLVLEGVGGVGRLYVNGNDLGAVRNSEIPQRFDITDFLLGNDELVIELDWQNEGTPGAERGGLYAPVVLEIVRQSGPGLPTPDSEPQTC